jgi:hypothetical protein
MGQYYYEINNLNSRILSNNEKIERMRRIRDKLKNQRESLKNVKKNKMKITSINWKKITTNPPKEITTDQENSRNINVEHAKNMREMIRQKIEIIKNENTNLRNDIAYYRRREQEIERG